MPATETPEVSVDASDYVVIPCSVEELNVHLRAFIEAFVLPHSQARCIEFLIDKRSEWSRDYPSPRSVQICLKADALLRMVGLHKQYCTQIPNSKRTAGHYEATFGNSPGVYFALYTPPCKLTAIEAEEKYSWEDNCAILSYEAGKKAIFFLHSGGVWKCEKV